MMLKQTVLGAMFRICILGLCLSAAAATRADVDRGVDLEVYGWLPIIQVETEDGHKSKITRDDILSDLDVAGFSFIRAHMGKWSLSSDFVYFKISDKEDAQLVPKIPGLAELDEAGMQAWIIRPALGYELFRNDRQFVELYAGGRYLWIEVDATINLNPLVSGSGSKKESPSDSNWDGIVGVRGSHPLSDKWFLPYSFNAGTGQSDFTWEAQAALGYRFGNLDAIAGWRYLYYDVGSDTLLKELDVNGPFVGAMFHW